ncbi:MAG: hypothetical protein II553_00365 [Lachnospiraceae bacterium]|nr:hypothetical protein [Lachnospiraceae bacterium]MBQ2557449.1 hypothetical protein [Lachnospiraceae bacterium]
MKKLELSNRTWIIIAASILVIVILIAVIRPKKKDGDLTLTSYDGTVTLTIPEVSKGDDNNNTTRHLARCKVDRQTDFFKTAIVKHDNFLGSISDSGRFYPKEDKKDTGKYLFLKDNRYFLVTHESGYALIMELTATVRDGETVYYLVFPCDVEFDAAETGVLDYASLETVNSYDDLLTFYGRIKDDYYRIDNPYTTVHVHLIKDGEISNRIMSVIATETGVELVMEEQ